MWKTHSRCLFDKLVLDLHLNLADWFLANHWSLLTSHKKHGLRRRQTASPIEVLDRARQDTLADNQGIAKPTCREGGPFIPCSPVSGKMHRYFFSIQALLRQRGPAWASRSSSATHHFCSPITSWCIRSSSLAGRSMVVPGSPAGPCSGHTTG